MQRTTAGSDPLCTEYRQTSAYVAAAALVFATNDLAAAADTVLIVATVLVMADVAERYATLRSA